MSTNMMLDFNAFYAGVRKGSNLQLVLRDELL